MATYTYTRVSTAQQVDTGQSLDTQRRTLEGYALMLGLTITGSFVEEGISGSIHLWMRPAGRKLLSALLPGDTVLTPKLDRMFRSASDALSTLETFKKHGVALHMIDLGGDVTTNGVSKLVFTILSAVAEAERDRTRERIREVKASQKAQGCYLGGNIAFGYRRDGGAMVEVPEEQQVIADIHRMRNEGASLRKIQVSHPKLSVSTIHRICLGRKEA